MLATCACTAYNVCMQYTIRGIPETLDAALRERARTAGKSLNEVAIEALAEGAGVTGAPRQRRNLDDIAGTWKADKAFDEAIAAQDQIDEDLWK
jgi:plasmid stability protein